MFKFTDYWFFILCIPIYKAGWSRYWGMVSRKLSCPRTQHNHSGNAGTHSSLKRVQKDDHWATQACYHQLSIKTITYMILLYFDWKVDPVYYQQAVLLSHVPKDFVSVNKRKWDVAQLTNFLKWLVHYIFFWVNKKKSILQSC